MPRRWAIRLIIRPAYTLGGTGGGIANKYERIKEIIHTGLLHSRINQVLLEQSVAGWKEIEYEVMRDSNDTCIVVCNMENIDPIGIHTGDSIVVAPSQTLRDEEYHMLRTSSIKIISALKIEGGCNVQFALNPENLEYCRNRSKSKSKQVICSCIKSSRLILSQKSQLKLL